MSHNRKVLIACNTCCNALVLYVTQGSVGDVSGAQTFILTVCIHIREECNKYLTSNNLKDFTPGVLDHSLTV